MEPKGKDPKAPVAALSPSPLLKKKIYLYIDIYIYVSIYLSIYIICLSAPGLSCSTQDLLVVACGI